METLWLRYMPGKKGDGNGGAGSSWTSLFPVVPDERWIDLDNAAGLNGRRVLACLCVFWSETPCCTFPPSLMEPKSHSCCHRLCVGGGSKEVEAAAGASLSGRTRSGLLGERACEVEQSLSAQPLCLARFAMHRCSAALSARAVWRGGDLCCRDLHFRIGAFFARFGFVD